MKSKIFIFLSALIITINSICVSALPVYASGGGGGVRGLGDWDDWTFTEKADFFGTNLANVFYGALGFVVGDVNSLDRAWTTYLYEHEHVVEGATTYEEWLSMHLGVDEDDNLVVDDELSDIMYQVANFYIEEYTGWYEVETIDYKQYPASKFDTQGLYNSFLSYCRQNLKGTDNILLVGGSMGHSRYDENNNLYVVVSQSVTKSLEDVEFYLKQKYSDGFDAYMTQEWQTIMPAWGYLYDDGTYEPEVPSAGIVDYVRFWANDIYNRRPLTDGVRIVRVYKTMEDLKSYSVGQRPYFTTSKFQDYDVNGDNSCIISESELNGSSVYGDVINYIIEYPDADGLTEDELRRILDEYFDKLPDGGGSDGGDSGGGFGDGLGGFLDGIGAIGDAILGILGKLLEYIGKAIELLSDTVLKVVDLIPKNITALISGLFPFLPQEWLTAIELSLVLAVIVGIVGIFKK